MLSAKNIENAGDASHYFFGADNYYLENSAELEQTTSWWGEGAKVLNLEGAVKSEIFTELLDGKLPTGDLLGRFRNGVREHRAGVDLTFSAPKSVSIVSEVCEFKDIQMAHEAAVNDTLGLIQKECAEARIFQEGKNNFVKTNNLVIAKIRHDVSRALDPQLHTHCIVMNMTQRPDGKWRSLARQDAKTPIDANTHGFLERIYENMHFFGAYYRASLAFRLKELNYELTRSHKDRFEIAKVPTELIKLYSKRREQIEAKLNEKGLGGAKASAIATLSTRSAKAPADRKELHEKWEKEAETIGVSLSEVAKSAKVQDRISIKNAEIKQTQEKTLEKNNIPRTPEQAVNFAIKHLAEREACFSYSQLFTESAGYILGEVHPRTIFQAIETQVKAGKLIDVSKTCDQAQQLSHFYTTPEAVALEKATIKLVQAGQNTVSSIFTMEKIVELIDNAKNPNLNSNIGDLANIELTKGQREAVTMILTSKDRVVGVQGDPGTGKTTMFKVVKAIAETAGYQMLGIATSANAARELADETGIKSMTLSAYLVAAERSGKMESAENTANAEKNKIADKTLGDEKTIIIVDEASQVSSREMHALLEETGKRNSRVVSAGDTKQLDSVLSGRPFYQLQNNGMQTVTVTENLRQKDQNLRASVDAAIQRNITKAIENLGNRLYEIENKDERLKAMVSAFLRLAPEERKETRIGVGSREDMEAINLLIRNALREEGLISGQEISAKVLVPRDFTEAQKSLADYYQVGNTVRFNKTYSSLKVAKNDYLTVANIDNKNNVVALINSSNKSILWNPKEVGGRRRGAVEIFETRAQKIAAGDEIRWTRNKYQESIYNGVIAKVIKVKKNKVTLLHQQNFGDKKKIVIDISDPKNQHWDYAYSLTVHGLQGDTCDRIFVNQDSYNKNLTTQKSFLVAISRARYEAHVFTDNKSEYIKVLQKYTGEKTTALEPLLAKEELVKQNELAKKEKPNKDQMGEGGKNAVTNSFRSTAKINKYWNADVINKILTDKTEEVITYLLGEPKKQGGDFWRYGSNKGSLIVTMSGERRGLWYDFQTNGGGNLINLIAEKMNLDFKEALEYAAKFLGLSEYDLVKMQIKKNYEKSLGDNVFGPRNETKERGRKITDIKEPKKILSEHQIKMLKFAQKLEAQSFSAKNTIVEHYLREHRKINITLPSSIRFHPKVWDSSTKKNYPAMLAIAKDKNGITKAVQVTYLDSITSNKARISEPKRTFGLLRGASVNINTPNISQSKLPEIAKQEHAVSLLTPSTVAIAEGVETALSVASARPDLQVYATLGVANFANFSPINGAVDGGGIGKSENKTQKLVICADNDGKNSASQKLVDSIANKLLQQKIDVTIVAPTREGQDFNDVLKNEGVEGVRRIIDAVEGRGVASAHYRDDTNTKSTKEDIRELAKIYDLVAQEKVKSIVGYENSANNTRIFEKAIEASTNVNAKEPTNIDSSIRDPAKLNQNLQQNNKITTQEFER